MIHNRVEISIVVKLQMLQNSRWNAISPKGLWHVHYQSYVQLGYPIRDSTLLRDVIKCHLVGLVGTGETFVTSL